MTAQRWYQVEVHRHGKGKWARHVRRFPSRIQAEAWARQQGLVTREEAANGSRRVVFRIVSAPPVGASS